MSEYELQPAKQQRGCIQKLTRSIGIAASILIGLWLVGTIVPSLMLDTLTRVSSGTPQPAPTATLTYEQIKSVAFKLEYEKLARNTEQYVGRYVLVGGEIIQVVEEGNDYVILLNMTYRNYIYQDTVMVTCTNCSSRPLQGDKIQFVAQVVGRQTYQTVLGASLTVPLLRWV